MPAPWPLPAIVCLGGTIWTSNARTRLPAAAFGRIRCLRDTVPAREARIRVLAERIGPDSVFGRHARRI
jgi:hypothetical protein